MAAVVLGLMLFSLLPSCTPEITIPDNIHENPGETGGGEGGGEETDPHEGEGEGPDIPEAPITGANTGPGIDSKTDWPDDPTKTLPVVRITTDNKRSISSKTTYIPGTVRFEDPDKMYSDKDLLESRMEIRGRGNTSWSNPKKPYKIQLEEKQKVFGMPKDREWVLLANYNDKSLIRNILAMRTSEICQMGWTPSMRSCNVYLNDSYIGIYTLSEQVEVSGNKIAVTPATDQDNSGEALTGDYFLEIDSASDEYFYFITDKQYLEFMAKDPERPTSAQQAYLKQYMNETEASFLSKDFTDPEKGYAAYVDVDSWIGFFIVQELSKNIDGNTRKSTYCVKHKNGKMKIWTVWDFDLAYGNCNYLSDYTNTTNGPEGWYVREFGRRHAQYHEGCLWQMFQDPAFVGKVKTRWNQVYPEFEKLGDEIDKEALRISKDVDSNFSKWRILGTQIWPNVYVGRTYQDEVDYLKQFYLTRLEWMNTEINNW